MNNSNNLIISNLSLADKCARKWRRFDKKIEYDDYYQQACLGLVAAGRNFNPDGPARFPSYAFKFMDGAILVMRSFWYTGYKEGLERRYPVPVWTLIDHQKIEKNEKPWILESGSYYFHNYALREQLRQLDISGQLIRLEEKELEEQREIVNFTIHIKAAMRDRKLSITSLSKKIGVSQPTLSRWLNNDTRLTKDKKQRILDALKGKNNGR